MMMMMMIMMMVIIIIVIHPPPPVSTPILFECPRHSHNINSTKILTFKYISISHNLFEINRHNTYSFRCISFCWKVIDVFE